MASLSGGWNVGRAVLFVLAKSDNSVYLYLMTSKFADTQADQNHRDDLASAVKETKKSKRTRTVLEVCQEVVDEKSATRFRGTLLDMFSASAVIAVHKALNEENKAKFVAMDDGTKVGLAKMVGVAMRMLK